MKNFKKVTLLVALNVGFIANAFADETYVICSEQKYTRPKNWEWLKVNGEYVKLTGYWSSLTNARSPFHAYTPVFMVTGEQGNENYLLSLVKECQNQYGVEWGSLQAANNRFYDWYPVGLTNGLIAPGYYKTSIRRSTSTHRIPVKNINSLYDLQSEINQYCYMVAGRYGGIVSKYTCN